MGISSTSPSTAATSSPYNAEFIYTNAAKVKIGFKTGEGLKSLSTSGDVYNAHFTHTEKSHLQVAGFDGNVIKSTSKGNTWNAIFEDASPKGMKASVNLIHPEHGTAIKAVTKDGTAFNTELSHQSKSSVNLVHGSGLAIDSTSEYLPNNKIEIPGLTTAAPTPAPAKSSLLDTSEELLQTREKAGSVSQSVSQPFGRFNARFITKTRSSAHVAKDDGTALELRTLNGNGPTMSVERGMTDATYQRVLIGQAAGAAIQGYTAGTQQYAAEFKGTESTVSFSKGKALIYAHSEQNPTDATKNVPLVSIRNNEQTILEVKNSGIVNVGENGNGNLFVSGNAKVQGSLHTVHAGETINLAEEIVRLRKQNEEMREMMLAMKAQNEAVMARMEALATRR